jgi:hypothetical protein
LDLISLKFHRPPEDHVKRQVSEKPGIQELKNGRETGATFARKGAPDS